LTSLGRRVVDYRVSAIPEPVITDLQVSGEVVRVDRFGNLITNIDRRTFERFAQQGPIEVTVDGRAVHRIVSTYSEANTGELCALFGSTDHLEIAMNTGNASDTLGFSRGAQVIVRRLQRAETGTVL
jgi:S-adenosylmethionine hydrolase